MPECLRASRAAAALASWRLHGYEEQARWRMKAAFWLIVLLPGVGGVLSVVSYGLFFGENIRAEVQLWACAVGVSITFWLIGFSVLFVLDLKKRVGHMGERHTFLDLAAEATRLKEACYRVRAHVEDGRRLKREMASELRAKAREAYELALAEWKPIIPSARALERRIKEALADDPQLKAAFERDFPKHVDTYDDELASEWSGLQMWTPQLEMLSIKMVHVVDEHDKRWSPPGSDWKGSSTDEE